MTKINTTKKEKKKLNKYPKKEEKGLVLKIQKNK